MSEELSADTPPDGGVLDDAMDALRLIKDREEEDETYADITPAECRALLAEIERLREGDNRHQGEETTMSAKDEQQEEEGKLLKRFPGHIYVVIHGAGTEDEWLHATPKIPLYTEPTDCAVYALVEVGTAFTESKFEGGRGRKQ